MREMMSYIFATLEHTEHALRNQARFNRMIFAAAVGLGLYSAYQTKRIDALAKKLKEEKED